jgi:hypothetical protein
VSFRPRKEAHVDEAGIHGGSSIIVIGVLIANNSDELKAAIRAVRDRHHFGNEIKSTKWSALRGRVYRDVLSRIVEHDIEGHMLIGSKAEVQRLGIAKRALADYFTEIAVLHVVESLRGSILYLDQKPGRSRDQLLPKLSRQLQEVEAVVEIDSREHDLMQIADLLCGTVYGVETGNLRKQELFEIIAPRLRLWRWPSNK